MNEYFSIDSGENMRMDSLRATMAAPLNALHISRIRVGMNRSAMGWNIKRFEWYVGLKTALYSPYSRIFHYWIDSEAALLMADQAYICWFFFISKTFNGSIINLEYDI